MRSLLTCGALVFALAVWTACAGDDPVDPTTLDDPDSGASTSGTSGTSGTSSGGTSSGTSGTSSSGEPFDGGNGDCRDLTRPTNPLVCPRGANDFQICAEGDLCCPGKGCLQGATSCGGDLGDGADEWQCFGSTHCTGDRKCFIRQASFETPDGGAECGVAASITLNDPPYLSVGRCLEDAPASPWAQLCQTEGDCINDRACVPAYVMAGGAKIIVKTCAF